MGRASRSAVMCVSFTSAFVLCFTVVRISMNSAPVQVASSHSTLTGAGTAVTVQQQGLGTEPHSKVLGEVIISKTLRTDTL